MHSFEGRENLLG